MFIEKKLKSDFCFVLTHKEALSLPPDLKKVDEILKDESLIEPLKKYFSAKRGRPSTPLQTYLRIMFLKHFYDVGYETIVQWVKTRIDLRVFCGLTLADKVPDATTLIKITNKVGDSINQLNEELIKKLHSLGRVKPKKIRIDTTVVESNISYPTDVNTSFKIIKRVSKFKKDLKGFIKEKGLILRDRTRQAKERVMRFYKFINQSKSKSKDKMKGIMREIIKIAQVSIKQATKVVCKGIESPVKSIAVKSRRMQEYIEKAKEYIKQLKNKERIKSEDRIVSLYDSGARAIVKKTKGGPQFGYKVRITTDEKGTVTEYGVYKGNPSDKQLFKEAIERQEEVFGGPPTSCVTDRGFYSEENERYAKQVGIKKIVMPKVGKKDKRRKELERQRWFKRLKRFRNGIEGNISFMKRRFGLRRTMMVGERGARIWVGLVVFAYNLYKVCNMG